MALKTVLEKPIRIAKARREDLLHREKGTDLQYFRDLEILTKMIAAAEKKLPDAV